ncbi:MAG: TSUP family transporter, partial [Acidiferrobacterales bacterium]
MMSLGVPGIVAVASNMCHKFPKAMIGAMKRARYGQVDLKLGIVMGISAEAGVLYGAHIQEGIRRAFGDSGSNLYVSIAFVIVLAIVGGYVLRDALKVYRSGTAHAEEKRGRLACWVQSVNIPYTMVYFRSLNARISVLFTIPLGFATGMLAATIAVGGFIGVPAMHYVLGAPSLMSSATELVVAFVMGLGGTIKYAWSGLVDIRLAMIILAGSLFGVQLGAIGTTYVRPYMIKLVMGVIMVLVLVSRGLVIPVYLAELEVLHKLSEGTVTTLTGTSFIVMVLALASGGFIILSCLWKGLRAQREAELLAKAAPAAFAHSIVAAPVSPQLSPVGRFERFLVASDNSEFSAGAVREAYRLAQKCGARLRVISVVTGSVEHETLGEQLLTKEMDTARAHLDKIQAQAAAAGIACETQVIQGPNAHDQIVSQAEHSQADMVIIGRRGRRGLARIMVGDATVKVIGHARCSVLVVPRAAELQGRHFLVASDGSRFGDAAAAAVCNLAKHYQAGVTAVSVAVPSHSEERRKEAPGIVQRLVAFLQKEGVVADGEVPEGAAADMIVAVAMKKNADLIVLGSHGRTGLERLL